MTKEYLLNEDHKIEVTLLENGRAEVSFFELTAGKWIPLGDTERWYSMADVCEEYGIEEG